jgi:hypothetical protein
MRGTILAIVSVFNVLAVEDSASGYTLPPVVASRYGALIRCARNTPLGPQPENHFTYCGARIAWQGSEANEVRKCLVRHAPDGEPIREHAGRLLFDEKWHPPSDSGPINYVWFFYCTKSGAGFGLAISVDPSIPPHISPLVS